MITSPLTFSSDIAPLVRNGIVPAFVDVEPDTFQIDVTQDRGDDRAPHEGDPDSEPRGQLPRLGRDPRHRRSPRAARRGGQLRRARLVPARHTHRYCAPTSRSRASPAVTSITAAGNGGLIAVDERVVRRDARAPAVGAPLGEVPLRDEQGATSRVRRRSRTARPTTWSSCSTTLGYNFEPSEIMAAYGLVQLDKLPEFNRRRRDNFARLDEVLAEHEDKVVRPRTTPDVDTTWMRYPFLLADGIDRTAVQEFLLERGVATRMVWTGNILRQPGFARHRTPGSGRRAPQHRSRDGPRACRSPRTTRSPATTSATWSSRSPTACTRSREIRPALHRRFVGRAVRERRRSR